MSTANENPPVTADTAATGWITAKINRDANGAIVGGQVTFDVNFTNPGPITFSGLHIHFPGVAGVNAPVTINTGIGGQNPNLDSPTGSGNVTRVVNVPSTNTAGLATLAALISAPDTAYDNIHTTVFTGGVARSQILPILNTFPLATGGGDWISAITIRNPSSTTAVQGIVNLFQSNGAAMPEAISDPNTSFLIPPSSSVTVSTHNKGALTSGFARVYSNGKRQRGRAIHLSNVHTLREFSDCSHFPVRFVSSGCRINCEPEHRRCTDRWRRRNSHAFSRDSGGTAIAGGSGSITVTAGQQITSFIKELLPTVTSSQFTGTLTITASAGTMTVVALQFDGTVAPVAVTALP